MKKIFLIVFMFIISNIFSEKIVITIAYEDKEQPPYYMHDGNTIPRHPGVAVEIVKMLEDYIDNLEVNLIRLPWSRCLISLGNSSVDGIFNASYSIDRALNLGWYPTLDGTRWGIVDTDRRITTINYSFYKLTTSRVTWDGVNLRNLNGNIGAPLGYSIVTDLKNKGFKVEEAFSTEANMKKLLANRVALLALQDVTADKFIDKRSEFKTIKKIYPPLETKEYYLMLSNNFVENNPELAKEIWDTIRTIRLEKIEELYEKYFE